MTTTTAPSPTPVEAAVAVEPVTLASRLVDAGIASATAKQPKDGIDTVTVGVADYAAAARALQAMGYIRFIDLSVVDLVETGRDDRFMVYLMVYSMKAQRHARLQCTTASTISSVTTLFSGAHNYEREAYDLFGVRFDGHPNLTRILLPEGWEGHPLQRDSAQPNEPVDFTVTRAQYKT
jgi:NADH-quinone oxidoreductase subunit C